MKVALDLLLGFVVWFVLTILLVPLLQTIIGESQWVGVLVALFFVSGIVVVPAYAFLRWYLSTDLVVTLESERGMTVARKSFRGEQTNHYDWNAITGTDMVGEMIANGTITRYKYYLTMSDGERLTIPHSTESFSYFLDIINRSTTHLPYTWEYDNYNWNRVNRKAQ